MQRFRPGVISRKLRARGALALAGLAATALLAGQAFPAAALAASAPAASLPAELQALELKMAQLPVNSERYSRTIHWTFLISEESSQRSARCEHPGHCGQTRTVRRVIHRRSSSVVTQDGEADLSRGLAEVSTTSGHRRRPTLIAIGSVFYLYLPGTGTPRNRPWVRESAKPAEARELLGTLFPFHGGGPDEVGGTGTGPYAGLIDLLATAVDPVRALGPAIVNGAPTSEFTAIVRPLSLPVAGTTQPVVSETLQLFLTEAGLPLRVVLTNGHGSDVTSATTDILAVNVPVDVKPPPRRRTIGKARYEQLTREGAGNSSSHGLAKSKQ